MGAAGAIHLASEQVGTRGEQHLCNSTCDPGRGYVGGWFGVGLGPGLEGRGLGLRGAQLGLGEPLHHGAVLRVTLLAATLLLTTVLGRHKVVAAVVAEDAAAQSAQTGHRHREGTGTERAQVRVRRGNRPTLNFRKPTR